MNVSVRPPAVAGIFYPAIADALARVIDGLLAGAAGGDVLATHAPKALIVPHAGYVYSGEMAAKAFACLLPFAGRIRRVVLLGPTHRVPVRGLAAPTAMVSAFATPLGEVPLNTRALDAVADLPQVTHSDAVHAWEHSLEVELPFLQTVLGRFELVPLVVGESDAEAVADVLDQLWGGEETLIVISSDLSHYHAYDKACRIDSATLARMLALATDIRNVEACGATPVNGLLLAAQRHGLTARALGLCNSGDTAGDRSRVVGYTALALSAAIHER
ncbi:AmmeMemoRadiSam system protein B [Rhodocyclus tenuis]|uniref:AmmeMemoRadiSam system protein B n=1 Tax=Rhodocyclus tenuis TaxID=1066 RepID=UPI001905CE4E|nr:AmmeMemoRadiSam system protein B [Rhodocyclus tenuis]MBK1681101.1 AmmeMemoRadiSam system protein B [Rhodocyclus tenuis]